MESGEEQLERERERDRKTRARLGGGSRREKAGREDKAIEADSGRSPPTAAIFGEVEKERERERTSH